MSAKAQLKEKMLLATTTIPTVLATASSRSRGGHVRDRHVAACDCSCP
jgi:hypothetical protein